MRLFRRRRDEPSDPETRLVVGLGNPGPEYEKTRHNVSYMVVTELARRHQIGFSKSKHAARIGRGRIEDVPVVLGLPLTFMNESGIAVLRLMRYFRIPVDHLLVVCDDLDLAFGTLRIRERGSSAGNRGLESIIQSVHSEEFVRLRIGIGRPGRNAVDHVLSTFAPDQLSILPPLIDKAADAIQCFLSQGPKPAMDRFNRDWLPALGLEV